MKYTEAIDSKRLAKRKSQKFNKPLELAAMKHEIDLNSPENNPLPYAHFK